MKSASAEAESRRLGETAPDIHRLHRFRKIPQSPSGTPNLRASVESVDDTPAPASASICGYIEFGGIAVDRNWPEVYHGSGAGMWQTQGRVRSQ